MQISSWKHQLRSKAEPQTDASTYLEFLRLQAKYAELRLRIAEQAFLIEVGMQEGIWPRTGK